MPDIAPSSHVPGLFDRLNRLSPQGVFVLIAGLFGLAFCFVTPPMQVPDEPHHWYRVYQLSQGKLLAKNYGGNIPASMLCYQSNPGYHQTSFVAIPTNQAAKTSIAEIRRELTVPLEPGSTRFVDFPNTALYTFLPYAPQTVATLIARKLNWPVLALLYSGRVGTVLGYVLIGWGAIRITPILKWPACMILACPMALFLAASVSADPITTAMAFLATAVALRCILCAGPLGPGPIAALGLTMLAVTLCKSAYFPLAFLALAVPRDKWGAGHRRWTTPIAIIVVCIIAFAGWSWLSGAGAVKERGDGPALQLHWIEHHPTEYLGVIHRTLVSYWFQLYSSIVGDLGWMDTPLLPGVINFIFIALAWLMLAYDEPIKLGLWPRAVVLVAVVACILLIFTANYMVWNAVGFPVVEGMQGRYFLPLGLAMCLLFRRRGRYPVQPKWMLAMLSAVALYTVWVVVERFYLPPEFLAKILSGAPA